jgi:DeoR/GlpR family transcriptional regulator of sugar metabolism
MPATVLKLRKITVTPRQQKILDLLDGQSFVRIVDLAGSLNVNPMTIHRDLRALQDLGLVEKLHGGARITQRGAFDRAYNERQRLQQHAKNSIGEHAAAMVQPGQSVLIDTGTTPLAVARALARQQPADVIVITSSLPVLWELYDATKLRVMALGGDLQRETAQLYGPLTENALSNLSVDIAFLGADAIDLERGFATLTPESSRMAAAMCRVAREWLVVADGSKIGNTAPFIYAPLAGGRLITDHLNTEQRKQLRVAKLSWEETEEA